MGHKEGETLAQLTEKHDFAVDIDPAVFYYRRGKLWRKVE
jgi:hypothetical protein